MQSHPGIQFTPKKRIVRRAARPSPDAGTAGHRQTSTPRHKSPPSRPSPEAGTAGKTSSRRLTRRQYQAVQRSVPIPIVKGRAAVPVRYGPGGRFWRNLIYGPDMPTTINGHKVVADKTAETKILGPALSVLSQTNRLSHGVAGTADAWVSGRPWRAPEQFTEGAISNRKYNFGQVVRKLGVSDTASRPLGFVLDVAFDPLTYVSFGTGTVAKQAAKAAGERAAAKAARAGMSKTGQKTVAARVERRELERQAGKGSGVTVAFAGKPVPGVTRATAAAGRGLRSIPGARTLGNKVAAPAKAGLGDFNPRIAPAGTDKALHAQAREAARTARATAARGRAEGEMQARAIKKQIGPNNYNRVVDAIEARDIRALPDDLREPAVRLRSIYRGLRRQEVQVGVPTPKLRTRPVEGESRVAKEYVPRGLNQELRAGKGLSSRGGRVVKPEFAKARKAHAPMAELRPGGAYSQDLALLHAARAAKGAKARAAAQLNRDLAEIGRQVKPGREFDRPADGEALYRLRGADLQVVAEKDWQRVAAGKIKDGRFFVLPREIEERARGTLQMPERSSVGTVYETAQRGFKRVATATPGFHIRNLVGDTWNAYLHQPGYRLPANLAHSRRIVKQISGHEAQARRTLAPARQDKTYKLGGTGLTIPGEGHKTYRVLGEEAARVGVARTGYVGRELEELGRGAKSPRRVTKGTGRVVRRQMQNREDLARVATWLNYRRNGMSAQKAAAKAADAHFDYSELTPLERTWARRIMLFYTFSARNIPLQSRKLLQNPGKFAALQKAREESGVTDTELKLSEYDQRQLPIAVAGGARSIGLPATDLNEFPVLALKGDLAGQGREYANRFAQLVSPIIKSPVEYAANYSFFFRDALENPDSPLVPAPAWVAHLPAGLKKKFGVTDRYVDKRTGKRTWGWYGKVDYVAKQLPGVPNFAQNISTTSNRRGQSAAEKLLAFGTGVRSTPLDEQTLATAALNALYKERDRVTRRLRALNQQGVNADRPDREYKRLAARQEKINRAIYQTKKGRGDKRLPKQDRPKKGPYDTGGYDKKSPYSFGGY